MYSNNRFLYNKTYYLERMEFCPLRLQYLYSTYHDLYDLRSYVYLYIYIPNSRLKFRRGRIIIILYLRGKKTTLKYE